MTESITPIQVCPCQSGQHSDPYLKLTRHTIMRCRLCGVAWTDPRPLDVDYQRNDFHSCSLGTAGSAASVERLPRAWQHSLDTIVDMLRRQLPANAHVHEVGCGQGLLLERLRLAGFCVTGIEPSTTASRLAQAKGLAVETGYFGATQGPPEVDCVIFSHVLEHIGEPHRAIAGAAALAPKGYVLFFQTNYRGLVPRIVRDKWTWIPEEHFWHFTPKSLAQWLTPHGYHLIETRYVSLVHGNWKTRMLQMAARCLPRAHDGFISLFRHKEGLKSS